MCGGVVGRWPENDKQEEAMLSLLLHSPHSSPVTSLQFPLSILTTQSVEWGQGHPKDEELRPQASTVLSLCHVEDEPQETAPFAHF